MQQSAAFAGGQYADGSRRAGGAKVRALQRIDCDVHFRINDAFLWGASDLLPDVQHRSFVALAFANHDGAAHRDLCP